jgi:PTH1 family peptidyl-tRNA hydrolase
VDLQLLVGLGNPGERYGLTRHNIGFMAVEQLARAAGVTPKPQAKLQGLAAELVSGGKRLRLLMPQTYMNESGRSVRSTLDWYRLDAAAMLVLVDDMDLPLGRLRLRMAGGAGGHNGLKSIIQHLGSEQFARLRIGIGPPAGQPQERRERTVGHVLGRFSGEENPVVQRVLDQVCAGIPLIQRLGFEKAATNLNSFQGAQPPS